MIKKHIYQITLLILLIAIFAAFYIPLRRSIIDQLEKAKIGFISNLEEEYNLSVKYRSASPTIINSLRILDLSVDNNREEGVDFAFHSERISFFYGFNFLRNRQSRFNLNRILIKKGTLYLEIPPGQKESSEPLDLEELISTIEPVLNRYFDSGIIDIRDVKVKLLIGEEVIDWDIDLLKLSSEEDTISLNQKGYFSLDRGIGFYSEARGEISTDLSSTNLFLSFKDFQSPYLLFEQMEFQVGFNDDLLQISKISDKFPLDLFLSMKDDVWNLNYQSENFVPAQLLSPGTELQAYKEWFDINIDGAFALQFQDSNNFSYSFDLITKGVNDFIEKNLGGESTLSLKFSGEEGNLVAERFLLQTPKGELQYGGRINIPEKKSDGVINLNDYLLPSGEVLNTDILLKLEEGDFLIESDKLKIGEHEGGKLSLSANIDWDKESYLANLVYNGLFAHSINIDSYGSYAKGFKSKFWFELNDLHVSELLDRAGYKDQREKITQSIGDPLVNSKGSLVLDKSDVELDLDNFTLESEQYKLKFNGYGSKEKILLSDIILEGGNDTLYGSMRGDFKDSFQIRTRLSHGNNYYDSVLEWNKELKEVILSGNHGLEGKLSAYSDDITYFSLSSHDFPLQLNEVPLELNLSLTGIVSPDKTSLNFSQNTIVMKDNPFFHKAKIVLSGNFDQGILQINQLNWIDQISSINGNGKLVLPMAGNSHFSGWLTMLSNKNERYKFLFFKEENSYNGYGEIQNGLTGRFKPVGQEGLLSANLDFKNIPQNPSIEGDLFVDFEKKGQFSCFTNIEDEKILLSGIQGHYGSIDYDSGIVSLNNKKGELAVSLGLSGVTANKEWRTGLYLQGEGFDILHSDFNNFTGDLKLEEVVFADRTVSPSLSFKLEKQRETITLYNMDRRVWNSYYNLDTGQILLSSQSLIPLNFDLRGVIREEEMDVTISNISLDLRKVNPFMPVDYGSKKNIVEFINGDLNGEITLEGTPAEPKINGTIVMDPLKLDTAYSIKEIGTTRAAIDITDNYVRIPYFEMSAGTTGDIGAKGQVLLKNWIPEEFDFDFSLRGKNGGAVPIIYPIQGLALNGEAEGDVSFYGSGEQLFITGEIVLQTLVMSLAPQTEKKPTIPKNERIDPWDLKVDLSFITGRNVSMVVPNEDFYFVKAHLDLEQKLRLQLDNIPWQFSLTGDLNVRTGEIAYFNRDFNLSKGLVSFNETQESFDPLLNITAETSLMSSGEDVTLFISYEGSLFSDFSPRFSSIPSYSEREILAFLDPLQDGDNSSIAVALGSYADKYTFSAPFEEGLKDVLNVDMVTIETGFVKNILEDQLNSGEGVYTNDSSQYNVARYLDGTVLNIGKYLGRDLFIAGGVGVDYDESQSTLNGLGVDFNIKMEMETPFFNIGWTYLPDDETTSHSSAESFVCDSSISINFKLK
ncbi:MAG: translocation/assembly module TamB domain-containing protein [Spirochaetales bacterium]|nr:translocation/assembly module TamB domain-containing protein [Spirochaetales bacterium]